MSGDGNLDLPELLVMLIQNMKETPFEKLIKLCEPITYSVMNRYFLPDYEREDVLQETRSVLIEAVETYEREEGMRFLQYYHMSLSNHFNMLLRKEHAQKRKVNMRTTSLDRLIEDAGLHIQGTSPNTTYPEDATVAKETYSNYLIDLSPFEIEVFCLFLNGKEQKEIVEELNSTLQKVRSALYRCSRKLKAAINE